MSARDFRMGLQIGSLSCLLCLTGCGESSGPVCEPLALELAIHNGVAGSPLLGLSDLQRAAVVDVVGPACSGVLVAPDMVLSAQHCLLDDPSQLQVRVVGPEGATVHGVRQVWQHPSLDLALLGLDAATEAASPLWLQREPLLQEWEGQAVELAGFGRTEQGRQRERRFAVQPIARLLPRSLELDGMGRSGACLGDSGGPLLSRLRDDGSVAVLGVLSQGSADCRGIDRYVRLDLARDWLEQLVPATAPTMHPGCSPMPEAGQCYRGMAMGCHDGVLEVHSCGEGDACGWSQAMEGFSCLPADQDPCLGVSGQGACLDGLTLERCDAGQLVQEDCQACGAVCGMDPRTGRSACLRAL